MLMISKTMSMFYGKMSMKKCMDDSKRFYNTKWLSPSLPTQKMSNTLGNGYRDGHD